jgi:hypothetical protein
VRILVAFAYVPFLPSEGREAAHELAATLGDGGWDVALSGLPIDPAGPRTGQLLALRLLALEAEAARLICLGSPACMLRHPDKRVWLDSAFDVPAPDASGSVRARTHAVALEEAQLVAMTRGDGAATLLRALAQPACVLERPAGDAGWRRAAAALAG